LAHPWVSGDTASRELLHEDIFMRFQAFNARRKFRATVYASIVRTKFQLRTKYLKEIIGDRVLTESELEDLRVNFIRMYVISFLKSSGFLCCIYALMKAFGSKRI
jgi:calcium-dependent protein kinase